MRLFVAIGASHLSFDPNLVLKKLRVNLERKEIPYRWVPRQNMHVTINFLGEVDEGRVPELGPLLSQVAQDYPQFELKLDGVEAFPDNRKGRVIVIGVQNSITLREMQSHCQELLRQNHFEISEKDYRPHLTIARLRSPRQLSDVLSPVENLALGQMRVKEITLYQSKLAGSFPVYLPLDTFHLRS